MSDLYRLLRLMPSATVDEIEIAYRRERARLNSPGADVHEATAHRLAALDGAHTTLSDPMRRSVYDQQIAAARQEDEDTARAEVPEPTAPEQAIVPSPAATMPAPLAPAVAAPSPPSQQLLPIFAADAAAAAVAPRVCPHCGVTNPGQATMCIACGRQVTRPCPNCGQATTLGQMICDRCHVHIPEYDQRRYGEAAAAGHDVQEQRREAVASVGTLEAMNRQRNMQAVLFWIVALAILVGLIVYIGTAIGR